MRPPWRWQAPVIEPDWLFDQYVNQRKTFLDLARETGVSRSHIYRLVKTHNIPTRRGGASHRSALDPTHSQ